MHPLFRYYTCFLKIINAEKAASIPLTLLSPPLSETDEINTIKRVYQAQPSARAYGYARSQSAR
jgi:hypothetical protein